jgi:AraC family transcriptional activator of pobA
MVGMTSPALVTHLRKPAVITLDGTGDPAQTLMPLFLAIEREAQVQSAGQVTAGMALLTAICIQLARLTPAHAVSVSQASSRKAAQIEKFRSMVDDNFKKHLPMGHYAAPLGITPGQLSRLCREVLGVSSLDVVNARVIHEAQRVLVYTGNSVKQLAYALGFADETYFCRFFRKHTGLSPREFRAKAMAVMRHPESADPEVSL